MIYPIQKGDTMKTYETTDGLLPAQVIDADALPLADEVEVGQIIAFYSRGRYRAAKVTKVTAKRVTAIYTTEGAHADAEKIAAIDNTARTHAEQKRQRAMAADYRQKADAIDAGEIAPDDRHNGCVLAFAKTEEKRAEIIQEWRDEYPAQLREWAANAEAAVDENGDKFPARLAEAEAADAVPVAERIVNATHVTTKNVKRDEVYALDTEAGA